MPWRAEEDLHTRVLTEPDRGRGNGSAAPRCSISARPREMVPADVSAAGRPGSWSISGRVISIRSFDNIANPSDIKTAIADVAGAADSRRDTP
jgi:hypothetical protein